MNALKNATNLLRHSVLITSTATLIGLLPGTAQALQVTVQPTKAALGDTLSVMVQSDSGQALTTAPVVKVNQKTFSTFNVGNNRWRALIPTTPLEKAGRRSLVVTGNGEARNMLLWVSDRRFPVQSIWLPPGKDSEGSDFEFDQVDAFKALVTPQKYWNGSFRRPNAGPITSGFGIRRYYNGVFANDYYHRGLDYAGATGSPVVAAAAGKVALVGRESQGFLIHGNVVGIDHGQGVLTMYLHLSRINVKPGDQVQAGQVIGAVGATGAVTGAHLHWGLYVNGLAVDPQPWLARRFE